MLATGIKRRTCEKCKETKEASEFYRNGRNYTNWCKECINAAREHLSASMTPTRKKGTVLHKLCVEMVRNAKKRALFGDKEFDLDVGYVEQLVLEFAKDNECEITLDKKPFKPSIDRINNSKGYTKENIKICWLIENYCKNSFTDEDVIEFCKRKLKL